MGITVEFNDFDEMMDFAVRMTHTVPFPETCKVKETIQAMGEDVNKEESAINRMPHNAASTQQIATQSTGNTVCQQPPKQMMQQPVQQPVTSVQTSVPSYTMDDLANAAMTLMDAGRQPDLLNLLAQFGVESLPALPPEQYGAFATALRELGAQI
jgi:hypothetical protein